jgi:hypothetical protein
VLGYRCLKLGTTRAPLRLRVVKDDKLRSPVPALQIQIKPRSFGGSVLEQTSTKPDGLAKSEQTYDNVAFAIVMDGSKQLARVPVEIVEDLTVTCPVSVSEETAGQGELLHRRDRWVSHLSDSLVVAADLFRDLNAMAGQSSESILARAQEGLKAMQADISELSQERESLRTESAKLPRAALNLTDGEQNLQRLQEQRDQLQQYLVKLQENIAKEKDPIRQKWQELVLQADLQEREDEFDKAIQLYERVLREGGDNPALRDKLDTLRRAWAPKNNAHAKARTFIYETWPKLETAAQIKDSLDEARNAFRVCKENGDILTPRKLLKTYVTHSSRLAKEVDALRPEEREDDRKTAETIIELTSKLKEFNEDVKEYLRNAKVPGK